MLLEINYPIGLFGCGVIAKIRGGIRKMPLLMKHNSWSNNIGEKRFFTFILLYTLILFLYFFILLADSIIML